MKALILFLALCQTVLICNAQTQFEMNVDASNKAQNADKKLDSIYQNIMKDYAADTVFIKNIKTSQSIWLQFRDAEMEVKFPDALNRHYGSVFPMCWSMYRTDLTQERINTLQIWIDGIEEGDVCEGSVKRKK